MTRFTTTAALAASIPDGAFIATGGFMLGKAPLAIVLELVRQERRGLRLISLSPPRRRR